MNEKELRLWISELDKDLSHSSESRSNKIISVVKEYINAAILADREERKLDVEKVADVLGNCKNCIFKINKKCQAICRRKHIASAACIVTAFSSPRQVSVEEMAKAIGDKIHCKDDDVIGCHINGVNASAQALHSLVYGDAVEYANQENSILGKAIAGITSGKEEVC